MLRKPKPEVLASRVNRYLKLREQIKQLYEKSDKLEAKILPFMKVGQVAGRGVLKDNYAGGNKAFRAHGISRFELVAVKS